MLKLFLYSKFLLKTNLDSLFPINAINNLEQVNASPLMASLICLRTAPLNQMSNLKTTFKPTIQTSFIRLFLKFLFKLYLQTPPNNTYAQILHKKTPTLLTGAKTPSLSKPLNQSALMKIFS